MIQMQEALRPHFGKQWPESGEEKLQEAVKICDRSRNLENGY
jgi:hypothetical protein